MKSFTIKGYDATIHNEWYEDGCDVLIGVVPDDLPQEAYDYDWWADEKIYYYLSESEFKELKVGDVLNDGENFTILEIDPDPTIYEIDYELETAE